MGQLISGHALKAATADYLGEIEARGAQGLGIFDKWFLRTAARLATFDLARPWEDAVRQEVERAPAQSRGLEWDFVRLRLFLDRWRQGRFVSYEDRQRSRPHYAPKYGTEFGVDVLLTCQGAPFPLRWRDLPLMKTVFDFAIYPQLLADVRPQSIFEIGSGSGASAIWLADHAAMIGAPCHVYSVDRERANTSHPGVTFYQGDCARPDTLFEAAVLRSAPHPWLVVEDAHANVAAVLGHFHGFLHAGDYLYVEDSEIKRDDIAQFLSGRDGCYLVDTRYTDFFGRNATAALDSIFLRTDR